METIIFETSTDFDLTWLVRYLNEKSKVAPPLTTGNVRNSYGRGPQPIILWRGKGGTWPAGAYLGKNKFAIGKNEPDLLRVARSFAREAGNRLFVITD